VNMLGEFLCRGTHSLNFGISLKKIYNDRIKAASAVIVPV
jgi:hypothetical protein